MVQEGDRTQDLKVVVARSRIEEEEGRNWIAVEDSRVVGLGRGRRT